MSDPKLSERLSDISTLALIDEIMERCSPAIFLGYVNEEDGKRTFFHYNGHPAVCYGLCSQLGLEIQKKYMFSDEFEDEI